LVRASYLEIYQEEIRDLLSKNPKNKLELHEKPETGVYVKELSYFAVKNVEEIRCCNSIECPDGQSCSVTGVCG